MSAKIFLETFGCSFNQASSEIMQGILLENKYQFVPALKDCKLIILNSCIVKTNTEARILSLIKKYSKIPNKRLLITGCMPEALSEKILQIHPNISLLGSHFITNILNAVQSTIQGKQFIQIGPHQEPKLCLPRKFDNPVIAKVQIAQGCLNNCSYCITKHAMGNLFSYPVEEILKEIQIDLNKGCREIWLTAQDTGCYGRDLDTSLPALLAKIVQIPAEFNVRVGMTNPRSLLDINDPLFQVFHHPRIYKFLHVPIQSGNDEILKKMNRQYTIAEIETVLAKWRQELNIALSIDIIVGFPSETAEQFEDTISIVKEIQPDIVNISKFGARPKTRAAEMKPLPTQVIKARSTTLSELCDEIAQNQNVNYVKTYATQRVLTISRGKKSGVIARTPHYKPVILKEECELGKFYNVQLISASQNYLRGRIIDDPHQ